MAIRVPREESAVRRAAAILLGALLLGLVAPSGAAGGGAAVTWTARLATNGSVVTVMPASGRATMSFHLIGLKARSQQAVTFERGSCAVPGTKVLSLPSLIASGAGSATRTVTLTQRQSSLVRTWLRSDLIVRVGSLCGLFVVPLPVLRLVPGERYFRVGGREAPLFMRNLSAYWQTDFEALLRSAAAAGTRLIRVQLALGFHDATVMTAGGRADEALARQWEQMFDRANARGIYVVVSFDAWCSWNDGTPDLGCSEWNRNPLNAANGGPAGSPAELFTAGSSTQRRWLDSTRTLVRRWQRRTNIAAWEIFSEVNIASGVTEATGVAFVDRAAATVRAADSLHRPVTASLAEVSGWTSLCTDPALDFNEVHPYPSSGRLDTFLLGDVRGMLAACAKPVLIGESGLNAAPPAGSTLDTAPRAAIAIDHAIWAGLVSGAMDARALWWQDSVGQYFANLGLSWVRSYDRAELAASRFAARVDFSGFRPIDATMPSAIVGAALGNERAAIAWFRDVRSEPPDWPAGPAVTGSSVTLALPGTAGRWQVDAIDTSTGTTVIASATATRAGRTVTVALPDFSDGVALKLRALP
jgi:hypothetical protein